MEQEFVKTLVLLSTVTQKLKSISEELDKVSSTICDLAICVLPQPQTISPEDYD